MFKLHLTFLSSALLAACGSGGSGVSNPSTQSNNLSSTPSVNPPAPLERDQFLNIRKQSQPFTLRFTSFGPTPTPIKGALAWIYESDKKTIKKTVTSNEFGEANFGAQADVVSFGFVENPQNDESKLSIQTIQDMPNTGSYSVKFFPPVCVNPTTININVTDIPAEVSYLNVDFGIHQSINYDATAHTANIRIGICLDSAHLEGRNYTRIVGYTPYLSRASSQNTFYFGVLNLENLTENANYSVSMNQTSNEYSWSINWLNATSATDYYAGVSLLNGISYGLFQTQSWSDKNTGLLQQSNWNTLSPLPKDLRIVFAASDKSKSCFKSLPFVNSTQNYVVELADISIKNFNYDVTNKQISWENDGTTQVNAAIVTLYDHTHGPQLNSWTITTNASANGSPIPDLPSEILANFDVQHPDAYIAGAFSPSASYDQYLVINGNFEDALSQAPDLVNNVTVCNFQNISK